MISLIGFNFSKNKKEWTTYRHHDALVHRFDKIMFLSCVRVGQNRYELTYLLDYSFSFGESKSLIPIKVIIPFEEYSKIIKIKFGVWIRFNEKYLKHNYLYVYRNLNNNRLIFKTTRHDNSLEHGNTNQYHHELVFKGALKDKAILEYMR